MVTRLFSLVAIVTLFAACVSRADGPSPTDPLEVTTTTRPTTTTSTVAGEEALARFTQCLGEAGVDIGPITLDGRGRPRMAVAMEGLDLADRAVVEAVDSCGYWLTGTALDLSSDPQLRDLIQAELAALAGCIRDRGVEGFPEPVPGFDGTGSPFPPDRIPWTDPALPEAVAVCSENLGRSLP